MEHALQRLLDSNAQWADGVRRDNPDFFERLAEHQKPDYLWIGCSDSRVPASVIAGFMPGELFVHRNIANVVIQTDLNCLSVMQYAVEVLQVRHIIVCGHYDCGGVNAACRDAGLGLIDNWLAHIHEVAAEHQSVLESRESDQARCDKLCELNVAAQVNNVCRTSVVRHAWDRGQDLSVHGLIYGLHDGRLRDLGLTVRDAGEREYRYRKTVEHLAVHSPQTPEEALS